jgi:gliding motility-associated-like protein
MRMKYILLFFAFIFFSKVISQRQASNWYFGNNAGINFDANNNVTNLNDGQLSTIEGCTSISNDNGQLLMYTDGKTLYNSAHTVMQNGNGLKGDQSSSQSAIIVPKPGDPNIYYIFTVGSNQGVLGLNYSWVDMTADNGLGAVIQKNINLVQVCAEKVSAVLQDCNSGNIWVSVFSSLSGTNVSQMNTFHSFEISSAGVNTTAVRSTFQTLSISELRGNLKFSPDGTKAASANINSGLFLLDFDVNTGVFSNLNQLTFNSSFNKAYGVEFSPNNQFLYVAASNDFFSSSQADNNNPANHFSSLTQFDVTAPNVSASQVLLDERSLYRSSLQLGPDGKIYRSMSRSYDTGSPYLSVINDPNSQGFACNYVHQAIPLDNLSRQGLPPFISSFFKESIDITPNNMTSDVNLPLCQGDTYTLEAEVVANGIYQWYKDDVLLPTPTPENELTVNDNGTYKVIIGNTNGDCNVLEGKAIVTYFDIPVATMPGNIFVCDDNDDDISDFDLTIQDNNILDGQDPTVFEVLYFISLDNSTNNVNPINGIYQNTSVPQTIYARVQNIGNPNCFALTQFDIGVYDSPEINTLSNFEACDDNTDGDDANGQTTINLAAFNTDILGTQNASEFTITYHIDENNALNATGALGNSYYNTTPFNQTLYVRIENNLNENCFAVQDFDVTINPVPTANNITLKQCDEDGTSDGITQFNLNEAFDDITNSSNTSTIIFYDTLSNANSETNPISGDNYTNTMPNETVYAVVTDINTGCNKIAELYLEISNSQISDYTAPEVCDELDSEDGLNTFDLNSFSTIILNGLPANVTLNYYETFNDAVLENNPLPLNYTNTIPYNQIIYSRAESGNDCFGIGEVVLTINPRPQLDEDELIYYCLNDFPITQTLGSGLIGDPNDFNFSWSTGETTPTISVNQVGVYTVTVTNPNTGCQQTKTITIEASDIAVITQPIFVNDGNSLNNVVEVTVTGDGIYQYALQNQDGELIGYQDSGLFYYIPAGIYTVLVKDIKNNCGITEQLISVIGFPNFFTPNNDGFNDYWQVYGVNDIFQPDAEIYIFDRYGKLLTRISPTGLGWDGTYNGTPMPTNDYWFMVTLKDGRVYKNNFTLKR